MKANELRLEANELQDQIQKLLSNFIEKSGNCRIYIDVEYITVNHVISLESTHLSKVIVNVTV